LSYERVEAYFTSIDKLFGELSQKRKYGRDIRSTCFSPQADF